MNDNDIKKIVAGATLVGSAIAFFVAIYQAYEASKS